MNGKNKGNDFERYISKTLSLWWTDNTNDGVFWRTSNSGGRYTVRKKTGVDTYHQDGDICDVDPIGKPFCDKFVLELKAYKTINLWDIVNNKGTIIEWWNKVKASATECNKEPLLIMKSNNKPIICMTTSTGYSTLDPYLSPMLNWVTLNEDCFIFKYDDLLKINSNCVRIRLSGFNNE